MRILPCIVLSGCTKLSRIKNEAMVKGVPVISYLTHYFSIKCVIKCCKYITQHKTPANYLAGVFIEYL